MENKEKLIKSLNLVINSLKNDTIEYNWQKQANCNCGIVAQAITGKNSNEIQTLFKDVIVSLGIIDKSIDKTWKNGVKHLCPITGESIHKIFNELFKNGLSKEDIVHLEFMDNPAILERSKIKTTEIQKTTDKILDEEIIEEVIVPHPNFFKRMFGATVVEKLISKKYIDVEKTEEVGIKYYSKKENLIKYLQAWVSILNEGSKGDDLNETSIVDLEHELLVAISNEDYDSAILLRDKLNSL